ncbi:MAG: hypothetical protein GX549_01740 [Clostridiales bacterium]|nr:hypothetical protein [Clostridiales bacterium]
MKQILILLLALALLCTCAGCDAAARLIPGASPTPTAATLPGVPGGDDSDRESEDTADDSSGDTQQRSTTHEPSIFVIEAAGSWQREVEAGYYINYECELYLDRIEPHDMHSEMGAYTGAFWLKVSVDAGEFISDFIKNIPGMEMEFNVEAEGISENLSLYLRDGYTSDEPLSLLAIPDGDGGELEPTKDTLTDKGSFVVSGMSGDLSTWAQGPDGLRLDYENSGTDDEEVHYLIHVLPAPFDATERDVKIQITLSDGSATVLDGTWRRLPGYPDDLEEYYDSGQQDALLDRHRE